MRFNGEGQDATNALILQRLTTGGNLNLYFSFRATGGAGGEGSHSASCTWANISIAVDYTPASGITKANRFAGVTPNFQETFNSAGNQLGNSGGVAGTLPDLWNYTYGGNGSPSNTTSCFRPVNARFTNHASVPAAWK